MPPPQIMDIEIQHDNSTQCLASTGKAQISQRPSLERAQLGNFFSSNRKKYLCKAYGFQTLHAN